MLPGHGGLGEDGVQQPHRPPGTLEGRRTGKALRKSLLSVVACGEDGSPRREWSAGGGRGSHRRGRQGGRARPGGLRSGDLCSKSSRWTTPSLTLPLTHQNRCSGVTSSSVALTLLLQAGGRDCKTSGRCQPETGSPHDSTSSIPTSLPLNTFPFSVFPDSRNSSERGVSLPMCLSCGWTYDPRPALPASPFLSLPSLTSEFL